MRRALGVFVLLAAAPGLSAQHPDFAGMSVPANTLGKLDAPVSIVIFTDFECPFSAATFPVVEQLVQSDPAHIHLTVKQFPLVIHNNAERAAEAVEAAGAQGKYFAMADLIQANQKQLNREQYLRYAELLHLDIKAFMRDLDSHRYRAKVQGDIAEGIALGINTTPTLLINGHTLTGSQSPDALTAAVRASLTEVNKSDLAQSSAASPNLPDVDMADLVRNPTAMRGPANAPVTIVEFTDFQCPFCRRASQPLTQLLEQSGTPVRYVFRNFPLDFHEHAELAAEAALAARAQGKFWEMHDLLFANQKDLSRESLIHLAEQLHLDMARFTQDLDTGKFKAEIAADRALGVQANVNGTPAFFINGRRIDGALTLPELNQAVALALNSKAQPQAASASDESGPPRIAIVVAGERNAPVTLTWFSDVQTSSAARMGELVRQLAGESGGKPTTGASVRVIFKFYRLPGHTAAPLAHLALIDAAAQGSFWPLYEAITALHFTGNAVEDRNSILAAAKSAGLDTSQVEAAMNAGPDAADLRADTTEAEWRGIRGAPTLFINQIRIDGLQSPALYKNYIQRALAGDTASGK